jgi:inorganic triphosphatase YgiF
MGIEFELKFRATPLQQVLLMKKFPQEGQSFAMETVYYDTPDSALSRRAYTLRRRMENDISVCTLKVPSGTYGRGEFEINCPTIEDAIPELCKLSEIPELPALLAGGVEPVCGAKFTRIARTVTAQGTTLEVALDKGILLGGGKTQPLCEAEVELKSGDPQLAAAYAARLAIAFGLTRETASKFKRAFALAQEG